MAGSWGSEGVSTTTETVTERESGESEMKRERERERRCVPENRYFGAAGSRCCWDTLIRAAVAWRAREL
jgi:hypothetical protein